METILYPSAIMNAYFTQLTNRLYLNDAEAVETCIKFIQADSKCAGHGRLRALMCHRLKHCTLSKSQRNRLVGYVTERLYTGNFAQQFKDELRLALFLDRQDTLKVALKSRNDKREYVRRYAEWVLTHYPTLLPGGNQT